jgi:hypothetical protein
MLGMRDCTRATLPQSAWETNGGRGRGMIHSVVAVHRLREVMCLYGFTRLEPAPSASEGNLEEIRLAVRGAPIAERTHWLPAIEQFGEGVFIRFDPTTIETWQRREAVRRRTDALIEGYAVHRRKISRPGGTRAPWSRLNHAAQPGARPDHGGRARLRLSRELAQRTHLCLRAGGRRKAALRHPALCRLSRGQKARLVQSTRRLSTIIHHALERLAVCSNDPVCADHGPGSAIDERALLGAACHGCLLIPETSCERRDNFLDRSLLVETMAGNRSGLFE